VEYVAGSFLCCSTDPNTCLSYVSESTDLSGETTVSFALPATPLDITSPVPSCFSYEVRNSFDVACNLIKSIEIEAVTNISGVSCPTDPSGSCPELKLITGQDEVEITTRKTVLSLVSDNYSCDVNGNTTYALEYQVDSIALSAGDVYEVDIYCANADGTPGTYIESQSLQGPIALASTGTVSGTVNSGTCNLTYGLVASVSKVNQAGQDQCLCQDVIENSGAINEQPIAPALSVQNNVCPSTTGSFGVVTSCGAGSHIEYSTDGGSTWSLTLPLWSDGLTVIAVCVSDADPACVSTVSNMVTAVLVDCCPVNCFGISITRN